MVEKERLKLKSLVIFPPTNKLNLLWNAFKLGMVIHFFVYVGARKPSLSIRCWCRTKSLVLAGDISMKVMPGLVCTKEHKLRWLHNVFYLY